MRRVPYDPDILQKVADNLYSRADSIIAQLVLLWMLILGGAGFGLARVAGTEAGPFIVAGVLFGGLVGVAIAQPRVLALKAEAQQLLVMREIEGNTRQRRADPAADHGADDT